MYDDDTYGSFKIGRSSFKYKAKHVFVYGQRYKATSNLWELLTKYKPDKNFVLKTNKLIYKYYFSIMLIELIIFPLVR